MPHQPGVRATALWFTLFLFVPTSASAENPEQSPVCKQVPVILTELTEITGMKLHHPVPCAFITKDDVNKFLKDRVKEVSDPNEVRGEELTLKKFGFVPADFDLAKNTVDLLTEQAAAFYDYNKKKLFLTESTSTDSQEPVLAHELAHALADQNYNLARFVRQGRKSDDGSTARLAVMEGQATWLMSEFMARQNGQTLKTSPGLVDAMSKLSDSSGGQYPVFETEPLYLRETLVFPYTKGMLFQNAVFQRDGAKSFGEVFEHPPVSTQQIMQPETYFKETKPTDPKLPDPKLAHGYKGLVGGVLGELEHHILLTQYVDAASADEIAPHWRGCNFELLENKKAGRVLLLYVVEWDSEDVARRYFEAYRQVMKKKWKQMTISADSVDQLNGSGDDGRFELRRTGAMVTSIEGLAPGDKLPAIK
jgi:IrrE N-terminal-like domain